MSTQSEFNANLKTNTEKYKTADNARSAAKKQEDKVAKVKSLNASITAIQQHILSPAGAAIRAAEPLVNQYQSAYNAYTRAHRNEPGYPSGTDTTALNLISALLAPQSEIVAKNKTIITNADNDIKKLQKQIQDLNPLFFPTSVTKITSATNATKTTNQKTVAPKGEKLAFSKDYKYNAPMIKSAYFGTESIQSDVLNKNHVDQGNYQDALQAWKGVQGGRGTIQMDRKFIQLFDLSDPTAKFDLQKYGFKFLYNPTTVSMAWGLMSQMDPTFEASGLDKFQAVSAGLLSSTVEFELMLNRIADFDYINEQGLKSGSMPNTAAIDANLDPAQRNRMYNTLYAASNPYPETVPIDDQREIYRKGTMYDIEYLLKTLNGPNGTFTSALNGITSDRGWMRPTIVELHLGNAMRYRVRIANLSVNHIMFNNRMVPILSTVKLTCSRFNDGPESTTTVNSGGGSNTPASGLNNLRNTTPGYGR